MTDAPPGRRAPWRAAVRGFAFGLGIGLLIAAIGQAAALALFVAEGAGGSYLPYLRIGAVYVELFHHVGVEIRALPAAGESALSIAIGIALLSVLAVAVVLLSAAGRRIARASPGVAAATVSAVALGYAVVPLALSCVADFRAPGAIVGTASIEIRASRWAAFLVPLAVACVAVTIGALSASTRHVSASPPGSTASAPGSTSRPSTGASADALLADVVRGAVRAFGLGLLLSAAGVLVLASVQPAVVDAYSAAIGAPDSLRGRIVVGGHVLLLLPNQAMWVFVPALGACDEIVIEGRATPVLCYSRMPTGLPVALSANTGPIGVAPGFRRPPPGYLAFLLVPLVATIAGGVRAGGGAGSTRTAVLAGATSGVLFAGLVAAGIALARIDLRSTGSFLGASVVRLEVGPELLRGTLLAAAWGVAGGAVGGLASRYVRGGPRYVGGVGAITE
jgi:hypothetical protein